MRGWWRDRSWEDRIWRILLIANVLVLGYVLARAPYADAAWLYRVTLWVDLAAVAWWVGRTFQALTVRLRQRSSPPAGDTMESEGSGSD